MPHTEQREMLLFSGGQSEANMPYFHYAEGWLPNYLEGKLGTHPYILYIPWAVWADSSPDDMFRYGSEHWGRFGLGLEPLHRQDNMTRAIERADAIIVGGGSIHMLVKSLMEHKLIAPVRERIQQGGLYIGESAGSVIACPTRLTALEPALIPLAQTHTLDLIPFQITPHYYDVNRDTHHSGPPPSARIRNYLRFNENPRPVVALKDGSCLHVTMDSVTLIGDKTARVFNLDNTDERVQPNADLSELLDVHSRHYNKDL